MIKDTYKLDGFNQVRLPKLKGHVKITLHNPTTGKNEVIEGDNIVTNAVRDIFASNYFGGIDYSTCFPLWQKWYSGVLVYKYAHDTDGNGDLDPNNYFPKNSVDNPVIAHAGPVAPSDTSDDITRGAPNTVVQTITDGSVTQGWEWGTNQGNGSISALSLTHGDTGNCGLGSTSNAFAGFAPFAQIQGSQLSNIYINMNLNTITQYDDNHGLMYLIGEDGEYGQHPTGFETNKVTVYIRRNTYTKAGLTDTMTADTTLERKFTVSTTTTWYIEPEYYFDYENKKLWLFTNLTSGYASFSYSTTVVKYVIIDCVNGAVDSEGTITSDTSNLARLSWQGTGIIYMRVRFTNIIKEGNYVYLPTGSGDTVSGYKKINVSNQSDQSQITINTATNTFYGISGGGLQVVGARVLNGATGYTCTASVPHPSGNDFWCYGIHQPNKVVTYATRQMGIVGNFNPQTAGPRYILANKMVNTTLYNLPSTVTKTSAQSMTITYTLTEVSS